MTKSAITAVLAVLAGCGGGDDGAGGDHGVPTDDFPEPDYGDSMPASSAQTTAPQSWLPSAVSVSAAPSAAAALALTSARTMTTQLLGPTPIGFGAASASSTARPAASGLGGDCATVNSSSITWNQCRTSLGAGITNTTDGQVSWDSAGTFTWDLVITSEIALEGVSSEARYHQVGTLTIGDGTISGQMLAELTATSTTGEYTFELGLAEAVTLDLTFQASPACVLSGTLEAQRHWTQRPEGYPVESTPEEAIILEWSGCGEASVATWMGR